MDDTFILILIVGIPTGWYMNYLVKGRKIPNAFELLFGVCSVGILSYIFETIVFNGNSNFILSVFVGAITSILLSIFVKKMP